MDTSERYIKMCEKADEIQKIKYPKPVFLHKSGMGQVCHGWNGDFDWGKPTGEIVEPFVVPIPLAIWLPRQDQLQEILNLGLAETMVCFYSFYRDWKKDNESINMAGYPQQFSSMEQLWLAFLMKEKYGKIWDGELWVAVRQEVKV